MVFSKVKRLVNPIRVAEILAAGEAIDEAKVLVKGYERLLGIHVELHLALDSKDLLEILQNLSELC